MFRVLPLIAAALAALLLVPGSAPARQDDELEYLRKIELSVLESYADGLKVELINNNEGVPGGTVNRLDARRWLAVPPGVTVNTTVVEADWSTYFGETVNGPNEWTADSPDAAALPAGLRGGAATASDSFRSIGMVPVGFTVGAFASMPEQPGRRGTAVLHRAVYDIRWSGGTSAAEVHPANLQERDPYLLEYSRHAVLNPEQVPQVTREAKPLENIEDLRVWWETLEEASQHAPPVMLKVVRPGLYRLTPRDLSDSGVRITDLRLNALQLYVDGRQIPAIVPDDTTGPFTGDASLWFYVPEEWRSREAYVPVWLLSLPDREPRRLTTEGSFPRPAEDAETPSVYVTTEILDPAGFDHRNPFTSRTGNWSTLTAPMGKFSSTSFRAKDVDPSLPATLRVSLGGLYSHQRQVADLLVNGTPVAEGVQLSGQGPIELEYRIPAGVVRDGENELTLRYPQTREERQSGLLVMSWAEVKWPVVPDRVPRQTVVEISGGGEEPLSFTVPVGERDDKRDELFLDVTDPENPSLRQTRGLMFGREYSLTGQVEPQENPRRIIVAENSSALYPADIVIREPENLWQPEEGADYLVIAHPDVRWGLQSFAPRRTNSGYRVHVVETDDVFDAFGYGRLRYEPIHDFLKYAWREWPDRRLSRVLLVGEASEYWWEMERGRNDVSENMVPVYGFASARESIRGDDAYARITGEGALADLEIGRISVPDEESLTGAIAKIFDYEFSPPAGPWMNRHLFYTDDEPEFARVAERIITQTMRDTGEPERIYLQDQPYEDYFRLIDRKRSTEMTREIIDTLSEGALTATYLGHGGPNLWSAERIFHYRDLPEVDNPGRFPIMTAASCDTAWVDYPVDPVRQSIGERFLLEENAGCVALFAPVAGTSSYEHDFLLRPFFHAVNTLDINTVGMASLYAKHMYMLERNQEYVPRQFILLGDPAMRIPKPGTAISLELGPAAIWANQAVTMTASGSVPDMQWGRVEATVLNENMDVLAGPSRALVTAGRFDLELPLPPSVQAGPHRFVIHAWNEAEGVHEQVEYPFEVLEPEVAMAWTANPAPAPGTPAGTPVQLKLTALNEAEGYMDELVLEIRDLSNDQVLTTAPLTLEPSVERQWEIALPTPPGVTVLEASARYAGAPELALPLSTAQVELFGQAPGTPVLATRAPMIEVERQAAPDATVFEIPVWNISPAAVSGINATLYLLDTEEGTEIQSQRIPGLSPGERGIVTFQDDFRFPEGSLNFRLDLEASPEGATEPVRQQETLAINIPQGSDLMIVPGSVRTERRDYVQGETVFVRARVMNVGREPVEDVLVKLYVNYPWDPASEAPDARPGRLKTMIEGPLHPGQEEEVRLRWDPQPGSPVSARLFVVANADRRIVESEFSNNTGDVGVTLRRLPNLVLQEDQVTVSSRNIDVGDVVTVTLPFTNDSPYDFAHPFVVELRAEGQGVAPELIYRTTMESLDAGAEAMIQAAWRADGMRDRIYMMVNEEREYGEETVDDNQTILPLSYVLNGAALAEGGNTWSLKENFFLGRGRNVEVSPGSTLQIPEFPSGGSVLELTNEYVLGQPLPTERRGARNDNLMLLEDGGISWTPFEQPEPVSMRIPLPADDDSTVYDVYFHHLTRSSDGKPYNTYEWTLEGTDGSVPPSDRSKPVMYVDRIDFSDGWMDLEFRPGSVAGWNTIFQVRAVPLAGAWTSPFIETDGLEPFRLTTDMILPEGTSVSFEMRTGTGDRHDPQFGEWFPVQQDAMNQGAPQVRILQVRANLRGAIEEMPVVNDIRLVFEDPAQVAGAGG